VNDRNSNNDNVGLLTSSILSAILFLSLSVYGVASAQQEPKATIECGSMIVTNLSVVSPPYDGLNLLGVITNNLTLLHRAVGVVGEFYDSNNTLLDVQSAGAEIDVLGPGERSPFKMETDVSNQTLDHYTIICRSTGGDFN